MFAAKEQAAFELAGKSEAAEVETASKEIPALERREEAATEETGEVEDAERRADEEIAVQTVNTV